MAKRYIATLLYIGFIVLLNCLFVKLPGVAAFGQSFSPADMLVGFIYIVRDFAQREIKHYVLIAMLVGALISYFLASKAIAIASVGAFGVGELIDWIIFTWTKKPLSQRLLLSSIISTPFDSLMFLLLAGRLHWLPFTMMSLGKFFGVALLWVGWKIYALHKQRTKALCLDP